MTRMWDILSACTIKEASVYIEMVGLSVRPRVNCSCKVLAKFLVGGVDCQDRSQHSAVETSSPGKHDLSTDCGCRGEGRHYHRH